MVFIDWWWDYKFSALQKAEFWRLGDVNMDGFVDIKDLDAIIGAFNTFHPVFDLNDDGIVNQADLDIATPNLGLNIWDYFGVPHPTPWWLPIGALIGLGVVIGAIIWRKRK